VTMTKTVLVTGTGARGLGAGILRALLENPKTSERWKVIAADSEPFSWGLYRAERGVVLPEAHASNYIEEVSRIVRKYNVDAIIPGTQGEMDPLLAHEEVLLPARVIANRRELLPLMNDKFALKEKLLQLQVPVIPTVAFAEWRSVRDEYGFPLVIKPTRETSGSKGVHLVVDEKEMQVLTSLIDSDAIPCVQPYIGSVDQEYTVGVLSDFDGNLIDSIVIKRTLKGLSVLESRVVNGRRCAISTGVSQGMVVENKHIQEFCENVAQSLRSRGPLNIQLRLDGEQIYIFEIHPRFSGTTPIRASVGFNEVDILLRNVLFAEKFGRLSYQKDLVAIRAFEHILVSLDDLQEGAVTPM